jgi:hypothetical protein
MNWIYALGSFLRGRLGGQKRCRESAAEKARTMNEEGDVRQPHSSQGDGYNGPSLPYGDPTIQIYKRWVKAN